MGEKPPAFIPPDGGWGWLVCFASFWINGTIFGIINSFGLLFIKMEATFAGADAFIRALVGSICVGMTFLMSPVASILTDKFGVRKTALLGGFLATAGMLLSSFVTQIQILCLTYGIMLGTGLSLCYTPSLVILGHYFQRHMGLVNGIVAAGSSVFTVVMPIFVKHLNSALPFGRVLQILSVMIGGLVLCSLTFRPLLNHSPDDRDTKQNGDTKQDNELSCWSRLCQNVLNVSIWKNKRYLCWTLSIPIALFGYFVPYVHLVKHVKDILESDSGEILVTCVGLTSLVGRIIAGKLADYPTVNRILIQQVSFLSIGVLTMLLVLPRDFTILIVMCLFMGFFDGAFISLIGPIAFDLVGHKGASQAIGFLLGISSIPISVGPPVAGLLYDHLGNYTAAFIAAGVPPIIGAVLMTIIHKMPQQNPDERQKELNKISFGKGEIYGISGKFKMIHEEKEGSCSVNRKTISEAAEKQNWNVV